MTVVTYIQCAITTPDTFLLKAVKCCELYLMLCLYYQTFHIMVSMVQVLTFTLEQSMTPNLLTKDQYTKIRIWLVVIPGHGDLDILLVL